MTDFSQQPLRRVLIASANPLFALGLQKLMAQHWEGRHVEIRMAGSMDEANAALENWYPDLVIVDYDDVNQPGTIQRGAFLSHFISGERPMQVMLVSLRETGEVVVYDRRLLTPDQAGDWLDLPGIQPSAEAASAPETARSEPALYKRLPETLPSQRSGGMKHYVIVGVITVLLTLVTGFALTAVGLMPVAASAQAVPVDAMINLQTWLIAFLFSLIVAFIGYSAFVFRAKKGETKFGAHYSGNTPLEVFWTVVPLITVIGLSYIGAKDLSQIRQADPQALEVRVTAFQWGWSFEYPDSGVTSNQLYLPVDRQVHFTLTSRDVIHSFWVPEFRLKQDVLPGQNLVKELRITPTRQGDYKVRCAEMCGGAHAYMESPVKVVTKQDFDAWIAQQSNTANLSPAERGARLVKTQGCTGCHTVDGTKLVGPTWKGLYGADVKLADGNTVKADDAYIHSSIVDPKAQVVEGFPPIMQSYQGVLSDAQIKDIIEYMKTLK